MPALPLVSDLRLAVRSLAKHRTVSAVAIATLPLSIGITTAVFSVVNGVVLRPLPFTAPDRLVALCEVDRGEKTDWCGASVPDVYDIARRVPAIAVAGVARSWPFMMRTTDGSENVRGGLASAEAFQALGLEPLAGRLIARRSSGRTARCRGRLLTFSSARPAIPYASPRPCVRGCTPWTRTSTCRGCAPCASGSRSSS